MNAYLLAVGTLAAGSTARGGNVMWDLTSFDPATRTNVMNGATLYFDLNATSAEDVFAFSTFAGVDGRIYGGVTSSSFGSGPIIRGRTSAAPSPGNAAIASSGSFAKIAQLGSGVTVGPGDPLVGSTWAVTGNDTPFANWAPGESGYIGMRFDISGETHYGWLNVTANDGFSVTLNSVGYNDTAGASSVTGVPEPSTLGLVALGAAGLMAWRRRK